MKNKSVYNNSEKVLARRGAGADVSRVKYFPPHSKQSTESPDGIGCIRTDVV
jgi:hypothetical protein